MAGVVSVERFSIALAVSTTSNSATLTLGQTTANCIPFITKRVTTIASPADDWGEQCVDVLFSGATVVVATDDATTRAMVVEVTVVEFDPAVVTVQQGTFQLTSGETSSTETITAVTSANTFAVAAYLSALATTSQLAAIRCVGTNATTLTFDRISSGVQVDGHWYVAESDDGDWTVDQVELAVAGTEDTATISAVTTASTMLVGSGYQSTAGDDNRSGTCYVDLQNTTTVRLRRNFDQFAITANVFVVEFTGGEVVQRGLIEGQGATASQNVTLGSTVTDSLAMVHNAGNSLSFKNASFPGTSSTDNPDPQCAWDFVDTDTIRVQHSTSGGEADNNISWEVIEWELEAAAGLGIPIAYHHYRQQWGQ